MRLTSWRMFSVLAGSSAAALSALLMQLALLIDAPLADYGFFAFLQVVQGLLLGVSSALFSAPLLSRQNPPAGQAPVAIGSFILLQLLFVLMGGGLVWSLANYYQIAAETAFWLGLATALQLWRWFGRSLLQNTADSRALIRVDASFSFVALCGTALLWGLQQISLQQLAQLNVLAAGASLACCGASFWRLHAKCWQQQNWPEWRQGYTQQGKPALVGVCSGEAAANAHSYLITFVAGPAAFAPIAAAAMLFRPCALLLTNFSQLARGQLLQAWQSGQALVPLLRRYRRHTCWLWLCNCALLWLLLSLGTSQLNNWLVDKAITAEQFWQAVLLWAALSFLRTWRSSATLELQLHNQFGVLARTALWPALLSVALVALFLYFWPPVWSLVAVIFSELWMARLLAQAVRRQRPPNRFAGSTCADREW